MNWKRGGGGGRGECCRLLQWIWRAAQVGAVAGTAAEVSLTLFSPLKVFKSLPRSMTQRALSEGPARALLKLENTLRPPVGAPPIHG